MASVDPNRTVTKERETARGRKRSTWWAGDPAVYMGAEQFDRGSAGGTGQKGVEIRLLSGVRLYCGRQDEQRVEDPLVGHEIRRRAGLEGAGRGIDLDENGLLQDGTRRRAAERDEAIVIGALADMRLDIGPGVSQDTVERHFDVEIRPDQLEARSVAPLIGEPPKDEKIARLRDEELLDAPLQRQGLAP